MPRQDMRSHSVMAPADLSGLPGMTARPMSRPTPQGGPIPQVPYDPTPPQDPWMPGQGGFPVPQLPNDPGYPGGQPWGRQGQWDGVRQQAAPLGGVGWAPYQIDPRVQMDPNYSGGLDQTYRPPGPGVRGPGQTGTRPGPGMGGGRRQTVFDSGAFWEAPGASGPQRPFAGMSSSYGVGGRR